MSWFFTLFYQPIYNLLVFTYDMIPGADIGIAIILVTIIVKLITYPLTYKSLQSQQQLQEIQPKIEELKEQYKDDKEKLGKEMMALYAEHKVNPMASCLPLLIQLPIFIALYQVMRDGLGAVKAEVLYTFVSNPQVIESTFLGVMDLAKMSIPLAILAGLAQYLQAKVMMAQRPPRAVRVGEPAKDEDMLAQMNRMMLYFMPAMTIFLGSTSLPGGVMLYWCATTLLTFAMYKWALRNKSTDAK
jgi:YidC/Oxa1 family membrane protein insertase